GPRAVAADRGGGELVGVGARGPAEGGLTVKEIRESNPSKVWAVTKLTSREGAVQRMSLSETRAGRWHTNHRIIDVSDRPEGACRQGPCRRARPQPPRGTRRGRSTPSEPPAPTA
ncbi:unnamed protein product, partial [Prorocentrum cordatum]